MDEEDTKTVIKFLQWIKDKWDLETIRDTIKWMEQFGVDWDDVEVME